MTIRERAAELGVSIASVSYALNDKPGVSDALRERILEEAEERGWSPNLAARALSGQSTGTVGMVLARDVDQLVHDAFYLRFLAGLQSRLAPLGTAVAFQLAASVEEECAIYERWDTQRRVDGLVVVDPVVDDPRIPILERLRTPSVFVGADAVDSPVVASVFADDVEPMQRVIDHLIGLGHCRIAHISGHAELVHTLRRAEAYETRMSHHGLAPYAAIFTDYSTEAGDDSAAQLLLDSVAAPTAIICDNDTLAVGVLRAATRTGRAVPQDLSVLSWEDSPVCLATTPQLSALQRDPVAFGARVATALLAQMDEDHPAADALEAPSLQSRGSTGPAPVDERPDADR